MHSTAKRAVVPQLPRDIQTLRMRPPVHVLDVMVVHLTVHQASMNSLPTATSIGNPHRRHTYIRKSQYVLVGSYANLFTLGNLLNKID
jgi:hypothetical protein